MFKGQFFNKETVVKRIAAMVVALAVIIPALAFSQTQSPQLPDYAKWPMLASEKVSAVLKGKDVNLSVELFQFTDTVALRQQTVSLIRNEQGDRWLAVYVDEAGKKESDGRISTVKIDIYMFEYEMLNSQDGNWKFTKSFLDYRLDGSPGKFISQNYGLSFR